MVHGCCLSSKTWETTPDGRMGWSEYFVRKDRSVYLADQVSRARSGFDPQRIQRTSKPAALPPSPAAERPGRHAIRSPGPYSASARSSAKPFADEQFPIEAVDELYKQMIPDLNSTLPQSQSHVDEHGGAGGEAERRGADGPLRVGLLSRSRRRSSIRAASRASSRSRCRAHGL